MQEFLNKFLEERIAGRISETNLVGASKRIPERNSLRNPGTDGRISEGIEIPEEISGDIPERVPGRILDEIF